MIGLALRSLAALWPSFAGSFVALALGVALSAAAGLVLVSAVLDPPRPPHWYLNPDVVVAGPAKVPGTGNTALPPGERGYVPAGVVTRLAAVPGVDKVVVDRAGYARFGPATEAHPWTASALHPYTMLAGGPPGADDQLVLPAPTEHRPGDRVSVATVDGPREFTVSGVLRSDAAPALYLTDRAAARLAGGRIAAVALFAVPGTDPAALATGTRAALADQPPLRVLTGDRRSAAEADPDDGLRLAAGTLLGQAAGIAAFVSGFVVAGTFALTVSQRQREFGLLRAGGASRRQVRRLVLGEAVAVGLLASLAGAALGPVIAGPAGRWLARVGLAPADFAVRFVAWPVAAAVGLGLVVAVLGAWFAARRASAVPPVTALREASVEPPAMTPARWLAGLASLAGAGVLAATPLMRSPEGTAYLLLDAMLLILGGALLAPVLVPPLVRLLTTGARGPARLLARDSALAAVRRTAASAAPVLVTVALAGAALAGTASFSAAQAQGARDHVTAALVVVPAGEAALPATVATDAGRLPGVSAAVPVRHTSAYDRHGATVRQHAAWYLDGPAAPAVLRLPVAAGSLANLTGETVALARSIADDHDWAVGSRAQLWLADGRAVSLPVVAIVEDRLGLPAVLLPWRLARDHAALPVPEAVYLAAAPGTTATDLDRALRPRGATVARTEAYLSTLDTEFDRLARLALLAIIGLALAYTGVAIGNTHLLAAAARSHERRLLRLAGASRGQLLRVTACEAAVTTAAGIALAAAVTGALLLALRSSLDPVVSAVPIVIPWPPLLVITGACGMLTLLAALATAILQDSRGRDR